MGTNADGLGEPVLRGYERRMRMTGDIRCATWMVGAESRCGGWRLAAVLDEGLATSNTM